MTQTLISSVRKNRRQSHYLPKWIKMAQDEAHRTKVSKIKKRKKKKKKSLLSGGYWVGLVRPPETQVFFFFLA